ncbi:MAG TPA: hypothetical protein VKF42_11995, partial [Chitinivibrionales bacterium]|nr:hypothetical protein [Chitinivibrionales bacterium]
GTAKVSVDVIDACGRAVVRIPRSLQAEGWHPVPGMKSLLADGVYVVRCVVDQQELVKRIMIVR